MVKGRLKNPVTDKTNASGGYQGLQYGLAAMQGYRKTMEDAHRVVLRLKGSMEGFAFLGVFDGHSGKKAAEYASKHLLSRILKTVKADKGNHVQQNRNLRSLSSSASRVEEPQDIIKTAVENSFLSFDKTIKRSRTVDDNSGTAAICVLVSPTHFYFVNCGDSRAFLYRGRKIGFATKDHKPHLKAEKRRIRAAGGFVNRTKKTSPARVNGGLSMSRSLGDFKYKDNWRMGQCEQLVIPQPEVTVVERDNSTDQFIVLACDGVFDVISNSKLASFIKRQMKETEDLAEVSNKAVDHCLEKGSRDNISIIILKLPGFATGGKKAGRKRKLTKGQDASTENSGSPQKKQRQN